MVFGHLQRAWDAYRRNLFPLIGGVLLILLPTLFFGLLGIMFALAAVDASNAVQILSAVAAICMLAVCLVFNFSMSAGYIAMCAAALKGRVKINMMIDAARKIWKPAVSAGFAVAAALVMSFLPFLLLLGLASALGSSFAAAVLALLAFASLIVIFVVEILLVYTMQAVALDRQGALAALKRSFAIGKARFGDTLALLLIFFLLGFIAGFVWLVGAFISVLVMAPVQALAFTSLYLEARRGKRLK